MEFRDLKRQYQTYKKQIDSAINSVISNTQFIGGKPVEDLENSLAQYIGVNNAITCANGTEAMTLIMMAWGIGTGDAVFVPDFTFFSSGEIVSFCGATPIFVDVDKKTFNMDPEKLELAINKVIEIGDLTPKVIIPVDLFGLPADYGRINDIAVRYNLKVLEDGAQGFGGSINGKMACSFGDAATTSFFPAKPLGCYGDGGAIFTDDDALTDIIRSLKVHGKGKNKYDNIRIGVNSRLDTIQAAILNVKLDVFQNHELAIVNRIYKQFNEKLKGVVGVPFIPEGYISSFAQYTITCRSKVEREGLKKWLTDKDIPSMIYYTKPMHKQEAFAQYEQDNSLFTITNELCNSVLSLPLHPYLEASEVENICNAVIEYYKLD